MASKTDLDKFLDMIDNLEIYSEDYQIIETLINNLKPSMFTKILEEVMLGNLYWSDFKQYLDGTNYEYALEEELKNQGRISKDLSKYIAFRRYIAKNYPDFEGTEFNSDTSPLCIVKPLTDESTLLKYGNETLYNIEFSRIRDNLLYHLTKFTDSDNAVTIAIKKRLYELIQNGYLKLEGDNSVKDGEYISPDDIFFFMSTYILPIDYEYQVLTPFDKMYMRENGLTETEMKKFKSLRLFISKKYLYEKNSEGGE